MATFVKKIAEIFRDYVTDGVPSSGVKQPVKADFRTWASVVEPRIPAPVDITTTSTSFSDMQTTFAGASSVRIDRDVTFTGSVTVNNEHTIVGDDASIITSAVTNSEVVVANEKNDWTIRHLRIDGSNPASLPVGGTAKALAVTGGYRWLVCDVTVRGFAGTALDIAIGSTNLPRGAHGATSHFKSFYSRIGIANNPGSGAEYVQHVAPQLDGNFIGADIYAGNCILIGGVVTGNTTGLRFSSGSNAGHGSVVGTAVNHNTGTNLEVSGHTNGMSFVGVHVYGDDAVGAGQILYSNSAGNTFVGGIISAMINLATGAGTQTGYHLFDANRFETNLAIGGDAVERAKTFFFDNINGTSGWSAFNDHSPTFARAGRGTSDQSISGATVLIFNSEFDDSRAAYNPSTGVFTAPWAGVFDINVSTTMNAASGFAATGNILEVLVNGSFYCYLSAINVYSATVMLFGGDKKLKLAAGATVSIRFTAGAGSTVVFKTGGQSELVVTQIH